MPIVYILIVIVAVLVIQRLLYTKFWDKGLKASVSFQDAYMIEEQETELTEVLSNSKWLPLPWVQLKFEILRNGATDNIFRADLFNILFHQRITRKSKIRLNKRGIYEIRSLDLLSYDMFITRKLYTDIKETAKITVYPLVIEEEPVKIPYEKLMGSIATRRYTLEDPFLFKGIRDYQEGDRFKDINFAATAKAGHLLTNTHEYTLDQKVKVVLLTDKPSTYFDENEYEMGLRTAARLVFSLEKEGIPVSFLSNGLDSLDDTEAAVEAGCSQNHIDTVFEALARLDINKTGMPGERILADLADTPDVNEHIVVISPCRVDKLLNGFQYLRDVTGTSLYLSPAVKRSFIDMSEREKTLEDTLEGFYFLKI